MAAFVGDCDLTGYALELDRMGMSVLLPCPVDRRCTADGQCTLLHLLSIGGSLERFGLARRLLAAGADPDTVFLCQLNALHLAVSRSRYAFTRLLCQHGADVNARTRDLDGDTPLHIACDKGDVGIAGVLLEHGADPNAPAGAGGLSPLCIAMLHPGSAELAGLLLRYGATVNQPGRCVAPLYCAASSGAVASVRLCLLHSCNVSAVACLDLAGGVWVDALFVAVLNGHTEIVRLLLAHGAEFDTALGPLCETPLSAAVSAGNFGAALALLQHGAHPDLGSASAGLSPLHCAARDGDAGMVRLLLAFGAALDVREGVHLLTPFALACVAGQGDVARLLLSSGAGRGCSVRVDGHVRASGHGALADWVAATATLSAFCVAAACHLPIAGRLALRRGTACDPTRDSLAAAVSLAAPCPATALFVREAMGCWSPERHWLFHPGFRGILHTVLLVQERLSCGGGGLAFMPPELWLSICALMLRRHVDRARVFEWCH